MRVLLFVVLLLPIWAGAEIQRSSDIFFAKEVRDKIAVQNSVPIFWWNFLVAPSSEIESLCHRLHSKEMSAWIERVQCQEKIEDFAPIVAEWAHDIRLRQAAPPWQEIRRRLNESLAKLTMLVGSREAIDLIRLDPLGSSSDLLKMVEMRIKIPFERVNGIFVDTKTGQGLIPFQFRFPPGDVDRLHDFFDAWDEKGVILGPHAGYFENERRVNADLQIVSVVGIAVLVAFGLFLFFSRRGRAVLLIPAVFVAIFLATSATSMIFGGIHGLTLAFGSGIIGLALDYGLHGAFNIRSHQTWISNFVGLLTTLCGLVILSCSSIPLIRQMMVFSILGLLFGYVIMYSLLRFWPKTFAVPAFPFRLRAPPLAVAAVAGLVLFGLLSTAVFNPSLDLRQFDFLPVRSARVATWLWPSLKLTPPVIRYHTQSGDMNDSQAEAIWSRQENISFENVATYLPSLDEQARNLKTWSQCSTLQNVDANSRVVFKEALQTLFCDLASGKEHAAYTKHLRSSNGGGITLWFPRVPEESAKIRAQFPDAESIAEVVQRFPRILAEELTWMVPISLLLTALVIFFYYRNFWYLLLSFVPFLSGLGLFFLVVFVFQLKFSFISVVGLVMVFGFSLDYGLFLLDVFRANDSEEAVLTALFFAALTNVIGFLPLVFALHPVLNHLGIALVFGTLGTFVGSVVGIPGFFKLLRGRKWI